MVGMIMLVVLSVLALGSTRSSLIQERMANAFVARSEAMQVCEGQFSQLQDMTADFFDGRDFRLQDFFRNDSQPRTTPEHASMLSGYAVPSSERDWTIVQRMEEVSRVTGRNRSQIYYPMVFTVAAKPGRGAAFDDRFGPTVCQLVWQY